MSCTVIATENAPAAIGPYSQGIVAQGKMVFVSGQVALNPKTGKMVEGGITEQTHQALKNLQAVLEAGGASLKDVVKTSVLLHNIGDFPAMNEVYATYFVENPPARATFGGLDLPLGAMVEIECVAIIE